jgi:hypothetical protein
MVFGAARPDIPPQKSLLAAGVAFPAAATLPHSSLFTSRSVFSKVLTNALSAVTCSVVRNVVFIRGSFPMEVVKRTCTKCRQQKDVGEFGKNKSLKGGISYWCLQCWRKYHAEYRERNREKIRARNREYSVRYYKAHKDKAARAKHPEGYKPESG